MEGDGILVVCEQWIPGYIERWSLCCIALRITKCPIDIRCVSRIVRLHVFAVLFDLAHVND